MPAEPWHTLEMAPDGSFSVGGHKDCPMRPDPPYEPEHGCLTYQNLRYCGFLKFRSLRQIQGPGRYRIRYWWAEDSDLDGYDVEPMEG